MPPTSFTQRIIQAIAAIAPLSVPTVTITAQEPEILATLIIPPADGQTAEKLRADLLAGFIPQLDAAFADAPCAKNILIRQAPVIDGALHIKLRVFGLTLTT